jgi:hypothetical protein
MRPCLSRADPCLTACLVAGARQVEDACDGPPRRNASHRLADQRAQPPSALPLKLRHPRSAACRCLRSIGTGQELRCPRKPCDRNFVVQLKTSCRRSGRWAPSLASLFDRPGRTRLSACPVPGPRSNAGSGANHLAQRMPTFVPRLAETAKLRPFEMPNSVLSHTEPGRRGPVAGLAASSRSGEDGGS